MKTEIQIRESIEKTEKEMKVAHKKKHKYEEEFLFGWIEALKSVLEE